MRLSKFISKASIIAVTAMMSVFSAGAMAQGTYPEKAIKIVVPYPAGGGTDVLGRAVAAAASKSLNKPIVVENRAGASGMIGADAVAKSPSDGYTLLFTAADTHSVNPHVYQKINYDARKDFTPIVQVGLLPYALVVNPKLNVNNLNDFLALAKKDPGKLTYASWGVGSSSQVAFEMLKSMANIDVLHVPFTGAAPAMTAVMSGQVDALFVPLSLAIPNAEAGRVKIVGLGSPKRFATAKDIPTLHEQGMALNTAPWIAILGPAQMPKQAVDVIAKAVTEATQDPKVLETLAKGGLEVEVLGPEAFSKVLVSEYDRWGATVKAAGIKAD